MPLSDGLTQAVTPRVTRRRTGMTLQRWWHRPLQIPRHVWLVDEFPMTVTGKIQKFRMRELAAQWTE